MSPTSGKNILCRRHNAISSKKFGLLSNCLVILLASCQAQRQQQQFGPTVIMVPGNGQLLRQAERVDQIILPYENFLLNSQNSSSGQPEDFKTSYIIDHKRFVEPYSSRCFASTLIEDPDAVEPNFVIVRPNSEQRINATAPLERIRGANFDARLPSTILVHGFTQSYPETDWLRKARALFEANGLVARQNLIIMDWGIASKGSYSQVAAMVSGMGSFLANFLMKLFELGADRRSIHVIGHSLGAHLVGFAGKRIRPHIGRITALDAAGPCFGKFFSNSPNDRLNFDDALEVDVYHYDDDFLGLNAQIGHRDIYVNGGSSQPGAVDNVNAMFQALITMVFRRNRNLSESHTRSTEVATSQLARGGCQEIAFECRDWPAFMSGECGYCDGQNNQCFLMSLPYQYQNMDLSPLNGPIPGKRLYIATGSNELFCLNHFQVLINFESAPDLANQAKRNKWRLKLEMLDERGQPFNVTAIHQMATNQFSYLLLVSGETVPTKFRMAKLQVRNGLDNSLVRLRDKVAKQAAARPYSQPFRLNSIEVNFMSNVDPNVRRALSSRLCPSGWLSSSSSSSNSIDDSSAPANNDANTNHNNNNNNNDDDEWLAFDECRSPTRF